MEQYSLSIGQARVCRWLGYAFGLAGLMQIPMIVIAGIAPRFLAMRIDCAIGGCTIASAPFTLLSDLMRATALAMPDAAGIFERYLALPTVRFLLLVAQLAIDVPLICLLLSLARGLHILGRRRGDDLARALPWLRRGTMFALVAILAAPLGEGARTTVLARAFDPTARFAISVEVEQFVLNLLLALVALAVTWALATGVRAERHLAEIV